MSSRARIIKPKAVSEANTRLSVYLASVQPESCDSTAAIIKTRVLTDLLEGYQFDHRRVGLTHIVLEDSLSAIN